MQKCTNKKETLNENENQTEPKSTPPETRPAETKSDTFLLRLYVVGQTPKSLAAIVNIKKICEEHLQGRYELQVIDLYQQPQLAQDEQIIAVPTLIKRLPPPAAPFHRRYVGHREPAGGAGFAKESIMPKKPITQEQLLLELEDARARLNEAEETLRTIRSGEVDALIVPGARGEQIFTLKSADYIYRMLIEEMNDGALTLAADGQILYANRRFAEMLKTPLEKVIGSTIHTWIAPDNQRISSITAEKRRR